MKFDCGTSAARVDMVLFCENDSERKRETGRVIHALPRRGCSKNETFKTEEGNVWLVRRARGAPAVVYRNEISPEKRSLSRAAIMGR